MGGYVIAYASINSEPMEQQSEGLIGIDGCMIL